MRISFSILILIIVSILLAYSLSCFYSYFYPMTYSEEIREISSQYDIDSALIASMVNAESSFKETALSSKGAVGLMQLMPSTAEWLAENMGLDYSEELLCTAEYNLQLGVYYVHYLMKVFQNDRVVLCAYNAGPTNVKNWLKNKEYSQDGKTLLKIPYNETEVYVNKVYKNYHYYKNKYK